MLISFYVDRQVMEDLRAYAEEKGQTVTLALERILRAHLDKEKTKQLPKSNKTDEK